MPAAAMVDGVITADAVPSPDAPDPEVVAGVVVTTTGIVTAGGGGGVVVVVVEVVGVVGVDGVVAAAFTVKDCATELAAEKVLSPACAAVIVQVPAAKKVAVVPDTVQMEAVDDV